VDQDFEREYPGKSEVMLRKWPIIAKQICEFAQKTKNKAINELGVVKVLSNWTQGKKY
jgi:hypothetical protein